MPKLVRSMSTPVSAGSHPSCQGTCMSHPAPRRAILAFGLQRGNHRVHEHDGWGANPNIAMLSVHGNVGVCAPACKTPQPTKNAGDAGIAGAMARSTYPCGYRRAYHSPVPPQSSCSCAPSAAARLGIADRTCYATLILGFSHTPAPFPQGTSSGSFRPLLKCHVLTNKCRQK